MEESWRIRKAEDKDAVGLKNCMMSAYTPYLDRLGGQNPPPLDVDYLSEIRNYPTWIVESDGKVIGGLIMSFENDRASIANIAIDPGCQGKGIGGKLMKFAEEKAREKGFAELCLATHVLFTENIVLYAHMGWQEVGRDETRVFMRKKL